jgi:integrase
MGDIKVKIYERVKLDGKWTRRPVPVPDRRKRDGRLFFHHNRQGKFQISWYENRKKQFQDAKNPASDTELPFLSDAVKLAEDKAWYFSNRHRNVADPTAEAAALKKLDQEIEAYLASKSGCKKTRSAHSHALIEFQEWATQQKKGRGIRYVDEITKPLLRSYFDYLVDGDEDEDGPENVPFTAAGKVMKLNAFYRNVHHLAEGQGVITKKDYKRELESSKVPEIFTKQEIDGMFAVMNEDDHLAFSVLYEAGLRKREWMHLEDTDLICNELQPGCFNCEIRVESKPHWRFQTKTGTSRNVWIPKELMDRLLRRKAEKRPSKLLFGTSNGKPDYHIWDRLKAIARRANLDPTTVWVHKWRATAATNWLRSEKLGGKGWDIGYVRQQLGHGDLKSIEHYIALVRNEERALREHAVAVEAAKSTSKADSEKRPAVPSAQAIHTPASGVVATGTVWPS